MNKLFGTDGIRGAANKYPITPEMVVKIGKAAAFFFKNSGRTKIIIGKDTRISGDMIESGLASGICSMGADVLLAGVIPTPGVAFNVLKNEADAGIVISASHNPYYDNGIKFFNNKGFKLSDQAETEIEKLIFDESKSQQKNCSNEKIGRIYKLKNPVKEYADFLKNSMLPSLEGIKIVIDCANGAACRAASLLFTHLKAEVEILFINPNGENINYKCGSEHPDDLIKKVIEKKADVGFAFDGDGDRLTAVDEKGDRLTGDQVLAVCANYLKKNKRLKNNIVISTVMSNMGLGIALKDMGIQHILSGVGDRYVMEKMIAKQAVLGGEDSGHMIFLDHHTTGDGILSALRLLEVIKKEAKPLSSLAKVMDVFPQVIINVEVNKKPPIDTDTDIMGIIKYVESILGQKGRVLVRYSGTQPLCRIMVEAPTNDDAQKYAKMIADTVKDKLFRSTYKIFVL